MWSKFVDIVDTGVGRYVPNYKSSINSHRRYYPARIRRLYANNLCSWKVYKTFCTAELLQKYKRLSKALSGSLNHLQNYFENNLVDGGNLGAFYKYVNKKLNGSNGIAPLRYPDGKLATTDFDKAALLNSYFCSVFTVDDGFINSSKLPTPASVSPVALPVYSPSLVQKLISHLKLAARVGPMVSQQSSTKIQLITFPVHYLSCLISHSKRLTSRRYGSSLL